MLFHKSRSSVSLWLFLLTLAFTFACSSEPQPEKAATPTPTPQPAAQMIGPPGYAPAVLGKPYPAKGVITSLNVEELWLGIDHEEVKDLMPAMQMEFWVRDPAILKGLRVGDKVDFVIVEDKKGQYVTEIVRSRGE